MLFGRPQAEGVGETLQKYAVEMRRRKKGSNAIKHDASAFFVVSDDRAANPNTWLLTQDRTLVHAAVDLRSNTDEQPFCVSLVGLLQTLSPYMGSSEEQSFADVFSKLLLDILPPLQDVYDIHDLRVLANIQDDVQQTPADKLVEAYNYVRRELSATPMDNRYDAGQVVLGLRRFLASSDDEQKRALAAQVAQARRETQEAIAEAQRNDARSADDAAAAASEATKLQRERDDAERRAAAASEELRWFQTASETQRRRNATINFLLVIALAVVLWFFAPAISRGIELTYSLHGRALQLINIAASLTFFCSTLRFVQVCRMESGYGAALLTIAGAVSLFFSGLITDPIGATASSLLQIASAIAFALAPVLIRRAGALAPPRKF